MSKNDNITFIKQVITALKRGQISVHDSSVQLIISLARESKNSAALLSDIDTAIYEAISNEQKKDSLNPFKTEEKLDKPLDQLLEDVENYRKNVKAKELEEDLEELEKKRFDFKNSSRLVENALDKDLADKRKQLLPDLKAHHNYLYKKKKNNKLTDHEENQFNQLSEHIQRLEKQDVAHKVAVDGRSKGKSDEEIAREIQERLRLAKQVEIGIKEETAHGTALEGKTKGKSDEEIVRNINELTSASDIAKDVRTKGKPYEVSVKDIDSVISTITSTTRIEKREAAYDNLKDLLSQIDTADNKTKYNNSEKDVIKAGQALRTLYTEDQITKVVKEGKDTQLDNVQIRQNVLDTMIDSRIDTIDIIAPKKQPDRTLAKNTPKIEENITRKEEIVAIEPTPLKDKMAQIKKSEEKTNESLPSKDETSTTLLKSDEKEVSEVKPMSVRDKLAMKRKLEEQAKESVENEEPKVDKEESLDKKPGSIKDRLAAKRNTELQQDQNTDTKNIQSEQKDNVIPFPTKEDSINKQGNKPVEESKQENTLEEEPKVVRSSVAERLALKRRQSMSVNGKEESLNQQDTKNKDTKENSIDTKFNAEDKKEIEDIMKGIGKKIKKAEIGNVAAPSTPKSSSSAKTASKKGPSI
jgi:hypothetical protein